MTESNITQGSGKKCLFSEFLFPEFLHRLTKYNLNSWKKAESSVIAPLNNLVLITRWWERRKIIQWKHLKGGISEEEKGARGVSCYTQNHLHFVWFCKESLTLSDRQLYLLLSSGHSVKSQQWTQLKATHEHQHSKAATYLSHTQRGAQQRCAKSRKIWNSQNSVLFRNHLSVYLCAN